MKPVRLTEDEKRLVNNCGEEIILEIIKGLDEDNSLKSFDCYVPKDLMHYNSLQGYWFKTERHLMEWKIHREPTDLELIKDATEYHNRERFRVWYVLHFPEKVERVKD